MESSNNKWCSRRTTEKGLERRILSNLSQPTQRDTARCAISVFVGAGEGGKPPFDPTDYAREMEGV